MHHTLICVELEPMISQKQLSALVIVFLGVSAVTCPVQEFDESSLRRRSSLVGDLREDTLHPDEIVSIEFLYFDVRRGWPFSGEAYSRMRSEETRVRDTLNRFALLLRDGTMAKRPSRGTRAIGHYFGFIRVNTADGAFYYIHYEVLELPSRFFVALSANSRNAENPNTAIRYYSTTFAQFLYDHDPWWRAEPVYEDNVAEWTREDQNKDIPKGQGGPLKEPASGDP